MHRKHSERISNALLNGMSNAIKRTVKTVKLLLLFPLLFTGAAYAEEIPLTTPARLELKNARAEPTTYHGRPALKLTEKEAGPGDAFAVIKNVSFRNGTIGLQVSGALSKTASEQARGFIGIAFRMQSDGTHFENFYIRPTNGRADDQLRRNHATQYVAAPDWPWERLRKEAPGVYESYADIAAGEWTHLRIVVHETKASLYVGDSAQPCLIVHDLKLGDTQGSVALWILLLVFLVAMLIALVVCHYAGGAIEKRLIQDAVKTGHSETVPALLRLMADTDGRSTALRIKARSGTTQLLPAYLAAHPEGVPAEVASALRRSVERVADRETGDDVAAFFLAALSAWRAHPELADEGIVRSLCASDRTPSIRKAARSCADALALDTKD